MKSVSFCSVEYDKLFLIPLFHESNSDNLINKADEKKGKNNRVVSVKSQIKTYKASTAGYSSNYKNN